MLPKWIKGNREAVLEGLVADHSCLLQAATRSLQLFDELRLALQQSETTRLESRNAMVRELASLRESLERIAGSFTTRVDVAAHGWDKRFAALERRLDEDREFSAEQLKRMVAEIRTNPADFGLQNPEAGLMAHLYSYLPVTVAIDVGANRGAVAERLLNAGYEVYAFEPYAPVFEILQNALGARLRLHNIALGSADSAMKLHIAQDMSSDRRYKDSSQLSSLIEHPMPDDLPFTKTVEVQVRRLSSLAEGGIVPSEIGLLKVDTEGYDLEVIRGMGTLRPDVLIVEYWAPDFLFGQSGALNRLDELVREIRDRDYRWYIVLYRIAGSERVSYYCNYDQAVSNSWGNVFFFHDRERFLRAMEWCSATLPITYFHSIATNPQIAGSDQPFFNGPAPTQAPHRGRLAAGHNGVLGTLGDRLDQLGKETEGVRDELATHARAQAMLSSAVSRLEGMLLHTQPHGDRLLQRRIGELEKTLAQRMRELEGLKTRAERIKRSYSWKLTSPLREIRRAGARVGRFMRASR